MNRSRWPGPGTLPRRLKLKRIEAHRASVESNKGAFHSYLGEENAVKGNVELVHGTHTGRKGWGPDAARTLGGGEDVEGGACG